MTLPVYDVVIIGAGPAGIQAAIHASRKKTGVLMLGRLENSALLPAHVENYACIDGVRTGRELLEAGHRQAEQFGTRIEPQDVLHIGQDGDLFRLMLEDKNEVGARSIIFAMGVSKKKLDVPGEKELIGMGVSYCVDCDANFYRNATVAVVGNRSAAADGALTLLNYASKVYLVAEKLDVSPVLQKHLEQSGVEIISENWVKEILGKNAVTGLALKDGKEIKTDGVFIELGSKGALELATQIGVMLDTESFKFIAANRKQETNIPGIYAAGDITGPPWQMAKAVGEGCVAGMEAAAYAKRKKREAEEG